jgi:hypothetical protein
MRGVGGVVLFLVLRVVRVGWEARVAWVGIYRIRVVPATTASTLCGLSLLPTLKK